MNIYDDNRLTRWGQRRLHSAFEEVGGSRTWTVPTIAGEIARAVTPYDWDRGRRTIESAIQAGDNMLGHRVQMWWQQQWTDPNSQYAVRVLTPEERAVADEMVIAMESMRPMGFLNVTGELRDHPDARAVCETAATRSTLFVTKDDATLVPAVINTWIEQHAPHWGIRDAPAVVDVEEAMLQWAKDEPRGLAEVALLAYWPEDRNASDSAVIKQTLACLRAISAGGTPTLGGFAVAQVNAFASDGRWMQTLRANPVSRTRAAERTHPRRNENQPAELAMRDPGAARPLRPPRLQAPAHAAAQAAARRVPMPSSRTPPRATPSKPERGRDD